LGRSNVLENAVQAFDANVALDAEKTAQSTVDDFSRLFGAEFRKMNAQRAGEGA
jgi:hypothetical protein